MYIFNLSWWENVTSMSPSRGAMGSPLRPLIGMNLLMLSSNLGFLQAPLHATLINIDSPPPCPSPGPRCHVRAPTPQQQPWQHPPRRAGWNWAVVYPTVMGADQQRRDGSASDGLFVLPGLMVLPNGLHLDKVHVICTRGFSSLSLVRGKH